MNTRLRAVTRFLAGPLALTLLATGCSDPPAGPSPKPGALAISQVVPNSGPTESPVEIRIYGSGFLSGATVTVGGAATNATVLNSSTIAATVPPRAAGPADIVVTNPGGARTTLTAGFTYLPFSVTSVSPTAGFAGMDLTILGTAFLQGATVTLGGVAGTVRSITGVRIVVAAPAHPGGTVDIVVTNPGGRSETLAAGFTYYTVTLTASPGSVPAGGVMTANWVLPASRSADDWIGLFRVGEANTSYLAYEYTGGSPAGTVTFLAPNLPGQYEFRYLLDDGYVDVARSNPITVTGELLRLLLRF